VKIPVVTSITAGRDRLKRQPRLRDAQYVAFLDRKQRRSGRKTASAYDGFEDPVRNARHHKVLLHRWFPSAAYSLWIDGSVVLTFEHRVLELVDAHLRDTDIAVFPHRTRTCVYEEELACIEQEKDDPVVISGHVERYRREGYPASNGLAETSVILRGHTPEANRFCEAWWNEIVTGSRRDQLSFPYVAWKLGVDYARLPGTLAENSLFFWGPHDGDAVAADGLRSGGR
jgi:alkaline ceramidase TOD1/glycosyltransferase MUCI70-like protein